MITRHHVVWSVWVKQLILYHSEILIVYLALPPPLPPPPYGSSSSLGSRKNGSKNPLTLSENGFLRSETSKEGKTGGERGETNKPYEWYHKFNHVKLCQVLHLLHLWLSIFVNKLQVKKKRSNTASWTKSVIRSTAIPPGVLQHNVTSTLILYLESVFYRSPSKL